MHTAFVCRQLSCTTHQDLIQHGGCCASSHQALHLCKVPSGLAPCCAACMTPMPMCVRKTHSRLKLLLCHAVCTAPSRLFVHEAIYDQFLDKVLQLTKKR